MNMIVSEPFENIFRLQFDDTNEMAQAFLRFQEHYESPEFKGRIFTLDEYKAWYMENSPDAKEAGRFTYYEDWSGFNIPSRILEVFYEGRFDPLSEKERTLLEVFKEHRGRLFYIIAEAKQEEGDASTFMHETAHGFFHTAEEYRVNVLSMLEDIDAHTRKTMNELLASFAGYHPSVFDDEVQAFLIADPEFFENEGGIRHRTVAEVSQKLRVHFDTTSRRLAKKLRE